MEINPLKAIGINKKVINSNSNKDVDLNTSIFKEAKTTDAGLEFDIDWDSIPEGEFSFLKGNLDEDLKLLSIDKNKIKNSYYDENDNLNIEYDDNKTEVYKRSVMPSTNQNSYVDIQLDLVKKITKTNKGIETEFYNPGEKNFQTKTIIDNIKNTSSVIERGTNDVLYEYNYNCTDEDKQNLDTLNNVTITNNKINGMDVQEVYTVNRDDFSNINSVEKKEKFENGVVLSSIYKEEKAKKAVKQLLSVGVYNELSDEEIKYDKNGKVEEKIVREFNAAGNLKTINKYDADNNLIDKNNDYSYGNFIGTAYQKLGNCYLLATLNSLSRSSSGQKILRENISVSNDENGQRVYNIKLPGAKITAESLKNNLGKDNVFIKDSYTVTQEELNKSISSENERNFSIGDENVRIYEIAFDKYRQDLNNTAKFNGISGKLYNYAGLEGYNGMSTPGYSSDGGFGSEAEFILTGKKPQVWHNTNKDLPLTIVNVNSLNHEAKISINNNEAAYVYEEGKNLAGFMKTADLYETEDDKNRIINKIITDAKDGMIDEHAVTAGIYISYSIEDHGAHQISIVNMDENNVQFIDSNDTSLSKDRIYTISMEDFKNSIFTLDVIDLS